jgi:transposase-like protein
MKTELPTTLLEAVRYFSDLDVCMDFLVKQRWPEGIACPHCEGKEVYPIRSRRIFKCKACRKQFSAKVGTIFEDSHIGLDKWLPAMWMATCMKNGVSSHELGRMLGVTQKTAWYMLGRIRLAMQMTGDGQLKGEVEVDETFIGGKARNMHVAKRREKITGSGAVGKTAVMGLLQRHGEIRTKVVPNVKKSTMQPHIEDHVEPGSEIFTDALKSYNGLEQKYIHQVIDHAEAYVDGKIHTNGLENFWSLFKRCIRGTYVNVEPFHLFRYLDEEEFRFNNRQCNDGERFIKAVGNVTGKHLTYKHLIGAEGGQ